MSCPPDFTRTAPFVVPPAALRIFTRSISDDDLCAWCRHLMYHPGDGSLCRRHDAARWPGQQDADGYCRHCGDFSPPP
ncbi:MULTISPECIES: hypothetical protein [Enterobacterales]|uniref:hypothetical protein n=1 Tax=Enterobacterales TaxID=91347 RepID=UPI000907DCF1|nr:hypothetical protein [Serratia marcescens]